MQHDHQTGAQVRPGIHDFDAALVALVPAHNDQPRRDAATVPTGGGSKGAKLMPMEPFDGIDSAA